MSRRQPVSALTLPKLALVSGVLLASMTVWSSGAQAEPSSDAGSNPVASDNASTPADAIANFLLEHQLTPQDAVKAPVQLIKAVGDRASSVASDLVIAAMNFIGVPYKYGGSSQNGFDCSGFTSYVYAHSVGLVLPRRADEQAHAKGMISVKREELQPGDLVFFKTLRHAFSHVGIYIGDHQFVHAPSSGAQVRIESLQSPYWEQRFEGARRASSLNLSAVKAADELTPAVDSKLQAPMTPVSTGP